MGREGIAVLEQANVELLKLVALCKDIAVGNRREDSYLLGSANIERLIAEGLLYVSKSGEHYRVTQLGYDLLNHIGYDYLLPT
jgi:hypothetical protein